MSGGEQPRLPAEPPPVRQVAEVRAGEFPLHVHPEWEAQWPWLVQGTTGRGEDGLDMGLFGDVPVGVAHARWRRLRQFTGIRHAVHARQVHGARMVWHDAPCGEFRLIEDADGHATNASDLLLTVSVADCVPISLVAPAPRAVALLHGGWRGVAAGILEEGIRLLGARTGALPESLHLHCGPAICGGCYEVGPEVPAALGLGGAPGSDGVGKFRVDVRAAIALRALAAGLRADRITLSGHCTRCGDPAFWSHRGGCRERQLGVLGVRAA